MSHKCCKNYSIYLLTEPNQAGQETLLTSPADPGPWPTQGSGGSAQPSQPGTTAGFRQQDSFLTVLEAEVGGQGPQPRLVTGPLSTCRCRVLAGETSSSPVRTPGPWIRVPPRDLTGP